MKNTEVERTKLNLPLQEPVELKSVDWIIITEENYEEVFEQLKQNGNDGVLVALTFDGYKTLSLNMAELRNFIIKERDALVRYQDYYE